ncbi:hypothetical protein ACNKHM_24150 [Shigella sonnei]
MVLPCNLPLPLCEPLAKLSVCKWGCHSTFVNNAQPSRYAVLARIMDMLALLLFLTFNGHFGSFHY